MPRIAWRQMLLSFLVGNSASAPTRVTGTQKIWRGTINTVAAGTATFQVTSNGLVGGTAIFNDLPNATIVACSRRNVNQAWQVQYCQIKSVDAKTVVINVVGNGSLAGAGIPVDLIVIGN